jgi:hypothetical protein
MTRRTALAWLLCLPISGLAPWYAPLVAQEATAKIPFSRDVRPLLAKNCFACHGPDEETREAGLRLDVRDVATAALESGNRAIVPGDLAASELIRRITSDNPDERMPPADSGRELTAEQIEVLRQWVAGGAPYAPHWSFVKPRRAALPEIADPSWPRSGMDYFIGAALAEAGLEPAPQADRHALARRLSFDLRGLPPAPEEVKAFVNDPSPLAYEKLVDRFLADPAFGERWARPWLDLARYADSKGYGSDPLRTIWRYRDWVIEAFNRNLPYDQFTIEQLAGDLLPGASTEQLVATGMHRNTMTNTEGGTDDEEFRVAAIKDRVDTTFQVWMGLTVGCAKCHNHKYDPLAQREYYQLYAFFNQTADNDQPDERPVITAPRPEQIEQARRIDEHIAALKAQLDTPTPELEAAQEKWEGELQAALSGTAAASPWKGRWVRVEIPGKQKLLSLAEVQVFSGEQNVALAGTASQSSTAFDGPAKLAIDGNTDGDYFKAKSTTHTQTEDHPHWEVDLGADAAIDRIVIWNRTDGNLHTRLTQFRVAVLDAKRQTVWQTIVADPPNPSRELAPGDSAVAGLPAEVRQILAVPRGERTALQRDRLSAHYLQIAPGLQPLREQLARLEKSKPGFPTVPVMQELPAEQRRVTRVMIKGSFLNPGDEVSPALPAAFHPLPEDAPANRLGIARWLVDRDNPLTARVAVNRFWAQLFGTGLVFTEEDFGTQGELPSHPELLDWLAVEFMDSGWDMKALLRTIVTSATYRQSSQITPEKLQRDPQNRLLSRGPRFRLEAEMVRDQALALAGLLSRKLYGPSVFPPQPDGLWQAAFNGSDRTWPTSQGEDRYRRGLYTFWRRTVPYPSMATFDAPSREICSIRRVRTNTPLQAFVTLNDPVYVEAAQALARRMAQQPGSTAERAAYGLELCLARPAQPDQVQRLAALFDGELAHYRSRPQDALKLASEPLGPLPEGANPAELAAWTVVANVLLNLDGVMVK